MLLLSAIALPVQADPDLPAESASAVAEVDAAAPPATETQATETQATETQATETQATETQETETRGADPADEAEDAREDAVLDADEDPAGAAANESGFQLHDGDRVVWLGSTFVERMQTHDFLETLLSTAPREQPVLFRNLGWSGDTARGHSRALFGKPDDGFKRLLHDVELCEPTVIIIAYGGNAAHAGAAGVAAFMLDMDRLLDELQKHSARIVLLSPYRYENLGPPLPDPAAYNEALPLYAGVLQAAAKARDLTYIDFLQPLGEPAKQNSSAPLEQLTDNGVHFSPYGYWRTAPILAKALGVTPAAWWMAFDVEESDPPRSGGVVASDVVAGPTSLSFTAVDAQLPTLPAPANSPVGADLLAPQARLRVDGLAPGRYGLQVDGKPLIAATHEHWGRGVDFRRTYSYEQLRLLRKAIHEKNTLFFHRHRPQNETYLFLFRQHEQGNNAAEVPQFDPLVEEKENSIFRLQRPVPHRFELIRLEDSP
ncbi:GDSL-type esterase/lipase family protein [Lignipirellula cremea]|uniref:GDSL-type esterase/lipase family protein n=1 Tax=Lignipirellula cremea TaxID=2528010 RepID=UPI0018D21661|nr:GDSL-type esterase/lipase family protein [Lignipirellula cremea]